MTLIDSINLWEIRNKGKQWFDDFVLDARIDRDFLYNMILVEYRDCLTMYADSNLYHSSVALFFVKNSDRIRRLLDTLDIEYDPIENYHVWKDANQKDVGNKAFQQDDTDTKSKAVGDTKTVTSENTEESTTDTTGSKNTNGNKNGVDTHYVSAFNNPTGADVEQYRDTSSTTTGETETTNGKETNKTTDKGTVKTVDSIQDDENGTYGSKQNTDTTNTQDRKEETRGITNSSYQELIDKQRRTVQFNITNWILREFAKELLLSIW